MLKIFLSWNWHDNWVIEFFESRKGGLYSKETRWNCKLNMMKTVSLGFISSVQFSSVQSFSHVWLFATPWNAARQASLSITNSRSLLKLMSIMLVMPSNYFILCHPLLPPSIFPSIRVFSHESVLHIRWLKYWSFSFNISPSNEYSGLISFRIDWFDLLAIIINWLAKHTQ